jgi:hypothetical protein
MTPPLDRVERTDHGETTVTIPRPFRIGLAALALALTTSVLALQPSTAAAACTPYCQVGITDIAVKFVGAAFRPEQNGNGEDVAFEIRNLGTLSVPYPNIKLTAECHYRDWTTQVNTTTETQPAKSMGMVAGSAPAPFLVSCPAKYHQVVSSVFLTAQVTGDSKTANNTAYWDHLSGGHSY